MLILYYDWKNANPNEWNIIFDEEIEEVRWMDGLPLNLCLVHPLPATTLASEQQHHPYDERRRGKCNAVLLEMAASEFNVWYKIVSAFCFTSSFIVYLCIPRRRRRRQRLRGRARRERNQSAITCDCLSAQPTISPANQPFVCDRVWLKSAHLKWRIKIAHVLVCWSWCKMQLNSYLNPFILRYCAFNIGCKLLND